MFSITGWLLILIVDAVSASGMVGLLAFFVLMFVESFGIPPLPSEIILPVAGFIVATGSDPYFTWPTALIAALVGSLLGVILGYETGRRYGLSLAQRLGVGNLDRVKNLFDRRGPSTVLLARTLPVTHAYISFPAGAAKMPRAQFSLYALTGSVPFIGSLLVAGFVLGKNWQAIQPYFSIVDYAVIVGLVALLLVYLLRHHKRQVTDSR
jgi:membrane protein DedA with SNARE-associated domain